MLGYRAAILWAVHNDDTDFLLDKECPSSVTLHFIADIYQKPEEKVRVDMLKCLLKEFPYYASAIK